MGANNLTICDWGCLMTDLAMILKYYGIEIDSQSANPSNLNKWLESHGGFILYLIFNYFWIGLIFIFLKFLYINKFNK